MLELRHECSTALAGGYLTQCQKQRCFERENSPEIFMKIVSSVAPHRQIPFIALAPFLLITFGLAWGIFALFILLPQPMVAMFGQITGQHPLFFLAVYAPAIAAFIVVTYHAGADGLRRYLSRLLLWHCSLAWYVFLIIGIPLLFFSGSALKFVAAALAIVWLNRKAMFKKKGAAIDVVPWESTDNARI
jgi:hypothetical protein